MAFNYTVFWTQEALNNLDEILAYLKYKWTQKEIDNFKHKLTKQIELIQNNPNLFPASKYQTRLRKAVLSKQTIIFYELKSSSIYIAYLFSVKQNTIKIK